MPALQLASVGDLVQTNGTLVFLQLSQLLQSFSLRALSLALLLRRLEFRVAELRGIYGKVGVVRLGSF